MALQRVVLPAPDGADMIKRLPLQQIFSLWFEQALLIR
jgi:hypothetical protein